MWPWSGRLTPGIKDYLLCEEDNYSFDLLLLTLTCFILQFSDEDICVLSQMPTFSRATKNKMSYSVSKVFNYYGKKKCCFSLFMTF